MTISADGNCLFRCLAAIEFGDEHRFREIKTTITNLFVLHREDLANSELSENEIKEIQRILMFDGHFGVREHL
jgi:hypothetical protein